MSASGITNKVWNYVHILRDDGFSYGNYVEQITYLIFLKMADEPEQGGQQIKMPDQTCWYRCQPCLRDWRIPAGHSRLHSCQPFGLLHFLIN